MKISFTNGQKINVDNFILRELYDYKITMNKGQVKSSQAFSGGKFLKNIQFETLVT